LHATFIRDENYAIIIKIGYKD